MMTFIDSNGLRVTTGEGKWISGSQLDAVLNHFDISYDEFREAVLTGKITPYNNLGLEVIDAPYSANWDQDPPNAKYANLQSGSVFDYYYKGGDIEKFVTGLRPDGVIKTWVPTGGLRAAIEDSYEDEYADIPFISGRNLLKRWNIDKFRLLQLIRKQSGVTPFPWTVDGLRFH